MRSEETQILTIVTTTKNILCRKVENSKEVMVLNSDFKFMLRKKIPSYDSIAEFLLLA